MESKSSGDRPSGWFEASVSGEIEMDLRGAAKFDRRPNAEDGRWIFLILLLHDAREGDGVHSITFSNAMTKIVDPGAYTYGDMSPSTFVGTYGHTTEGGSVGTYIAKEGALHILEANPRVVRGRFSFRGTGSDNFNLWAVRSEVFLEGEFAAEIDPSTFPLAFPRPGEEGV